MLTPACRNKPVYDNVIIHEIKKLRPLIPKGYLSEQVLEDNEGNQLIQISCKTDVKTKLSNFQYHM